MKAHYTDYDEEVAPTVFMPKQMHYNTTATYNRWKAEIVRRTGSFDMANVSEEEIRALAEKMMKDGNVPQAVRDEYWKDFNRMLKAFAEGRHKK